MGATLWILAIDENKKLLRLPLNIFEGKKSKIQNQVVKVAELMIINKNRKPINVLNTWYYKLKFRDDGTLDEEYYEESRELHFLSINMLGENLTNKQILSKIKYEKKYSWVPSAKEIKLINQYLNKRGIPLTELLLFR